MVSTAADLRKFFSLLHGGSILSAASLKKMREQYNEPVPTSFAPMYEGLPATASGSQGLGLGIIENEGETEYAHGGSLTGFQGYVSYDTGSVVYAAALINGSISNPPSLAAMLCRKVGSVFP